MRAPNFTKPHDPVFDYLRSKGLPITHDTIAAARLMLSQRDAGDNADRGKNDSILDDAAKDLNPGSLFMNMARLDAAAPAVLPALARMALMGL